MLGETFCCSDTHIHTRTPADDNTQTPGLEGPAVGRLSASVHHPPLLLTWGQIATGRVQLGSSPDPSLLRAFRAAVGGRTHTSS